MNHIFNIEFATKNSVEEAVILENIIFWCQKNKANNESFFDGNYWTYNSVKAFCEIFPYLTARKIDYALKKLEEKGYIMTGNYNKSAYDRTKWFAITDLTKAFYGIEKSISQKRKMEITNNENGFVGNVKPIPYINTNINTDINTDINNYDLNKNININKEKNNKKENFEEIISKQDEKIQESLRQFILMRTKIKKPFTNYSFKLMVDKLKKMGSVAEQKEILENSISNCWQGIFELKEKKSSVLIDTDEKDYTKGMELFNRGNK